MGCGSSRKVMDNMKSVEKADTLVGLLDVHIINAGMF